jgi:excisionase family DNA binding protein
MDNLIPDKPLFRPDEVAGLFLISTRTVYNWVAEGRIPAVKVGPYGIIRIKRDDVEKMILDEDC